MPAFLERQHRTLLAAAAMAAALWLHAAAPAEAVEYRLQPGDTVELSVAGIPDLRHKAALGLDGVLSLPLIGEVKAAGMTLSDLRNKVRDLFPEQVYRSRAGANRPGDVILASEVTIEMAAYRPVYISGDVSKPGAQAFLPGMTVRQIVAVAGGYGSSDLSPHDAAMRVAEITAREATLSATLERETARVQRLEAELGTDTETRAVPRSAAAKVEALLKHERDADWAAQRTALETAFKRQQERLASLSRRKGNGQSAQAISEDEVTRLKGLKKKGLVTGTRLADAQRSALASSNDMLQNEELIAQAERDMDTSALQIERLDHQRRASLLGELQDARMALAAAEANLKAARQQARLLPQSRPAASVPVTVILTRMGEPGQSMHIAADEDTPLMPGDVVQVTVGDPSIGEVASAE